VARDSQPGAWHQPYQAGDREGPVPPCHRIGSL